MSSPNSPGRALFFACLLCFSAAALPAQDNVSGYDPFAEPAIMHIGFLNTDCVTDTVYGLLDRHLRWTPRYICWGDRYDSAGASLCSSGGNDSTTSRASRYDTTHLSFPDWREFFCAFSVQRYNANDTLDDLIFWMRGVDSLPGRGLVDTGSAVVVFGQSSLETNAVLSLTGIRAFRSQPFYAMELGRGYELIHPKKREALTRRVSWELVRPDRQVLEEEDEETEERTDAPVPGVLSSVDEVPEYQARIYPNPAIYTTSVEVAPLPAGSYVVAVLGVNGEEVYRSEVLLESEGEVFRTIDLESLSSGYYALRITRLDALIGIYPIIVVR